MKADFKGIVDRLACPDDGSRLELLVSAFRCRECSRQFPILEDDLAEILPLGPKALPDSVSEEYRCGYKTLFTTNFHFASEAPAWGAEEHVPKKWADLRRRQVNLAQRMIQPACASNSVVCDISAGAGYYTFAHANLFGTVVHCDLSAANLVYSWRKARKYNVQNVLFLRTDYFALPFRRSLDRIVCMDTLIRGPQHDRLVLKEILAALHPNGIAVVDFHNWWHNPVRRTGLLKQNFRHNYSYTKGEANKLIKEVTDRGWECVRFHQEFSTERDAARLLAKLLPATRFLFALKGTDDQSVVRRSEAVVRSELAEAGRGR